MATESEAPHRLTEPGSMRIGLFVPCYVDMLFSVVAIATLELLELSFAKILSSSLWTARLPAATIANDLCFKLGLRVSPRTVRKYLPTHLDSGRGQHARSQHWFAP
jgi:hypothetical protein